MASVRNILFIMCDQLRADYLGCNGHPHVRTPHIDAMAARGVNFIRAYCQAPVCGPSRMSFYTGRYMRSHGSTYNGVPLRLGELTLGDYMRDLGVRTGLVGKTHMAADRAGMQRLGIDPGSDPGVLSSQCGFEPWERDDGLHPDQSVDANLPYNVYLRSKGYAGDNPWHSYANSAEGPDGEILSGWLMRNSRLAARVHRDHSETAYMTDLAMAKIAELGDQPWCLHLSYIKPHWPYMAPAPYHDMYGAGDVLPANRSDAEQLSPHPVVAAFMQHEEAVNFARDEVRNTVIPAYMGLISEIDDHMGRLMAFLETSGRLADTMIVFTSDHGDYLGDHWLGEKELFHDAASRIPLIVIDPDAAADATRGSHSEQLVEAIDLLPTFTDVLGGGTHTHALEGRSLLALTRGTLAEPWREAVFSEADYGFRAARHSLDLQPGHTRAFMVRTGKWKYICYPGFRSQLFDLQADPGEVLDLGTSDAHADVCRDMERRLADWFKTAKVRATMTDARVEASTNTHKSRGIIFGEW